MKRRVYKNYLQKVLELQHKTIRLIGEIEPQVIEHYIKPGNTYGVKYRFSRINARADISTINKSFSVLKGNSVIY